MRIPKAIEEINQVRSELIKFKPSEVVWDIEDLSKQPPWGNNISEIITDLSNYFVTSDGRDLFSVILKAFEEAIQLNEDVEILSL